MLTLILIAAAVLAVATVAALRWKRHEIGTAGARLADFLVRLRNHVLGGLGFLLFLTPEIADVLREATRNPDFVALVPEAWLHWLGVVLLVLGAYARFRPATRTHDAEVQTVLAAREAANESGVPVPVLVDAGGGPPVQVATVRPKGRGV